MSEKITAIVPTFNNAQLIRDCLESVKWADEILLCDSFSTDATLEIAVEFGARVVHHEYVNSAVQKNWAIPQCSHQWIFQIDTDERLEEGMQQEIRNILAAPPQGVDGFRVSRKNYVLGRWVRVADLYPDKAIRLFRRDAGRFEEKEVHAKVVVPGKVGKLQHHILHQGMPCISKQLSNIDRYSRYQADELRKRGKKFHWYHLFLRPWIVFGYYYLWRLGFLAGYRGFLLSALNATYDFYSHAKLWELGKLKLKKSPK